MATVKKVLAYTSVAVLLGIVTMLAPFALIVSEIGTSGMDTQAEQSYFSPTNTRAMSSETERAYGIPPATYSPDILFIAFTLTLSLVIALGVMRYFIRKTAS